MSTQKAKYSALSLSLPTSELTKLLEMTREQWTSKFKAKHI